MGEEGFLSLSAWKFLIFECVSNLNSFEFIEILASPSFCIHPSHQHQQAHAACSISRWRWHDDDEDDDHDRSFHSARGSETAHSTFTFDLTLRSRRAKRKMWLCVWIPSFDEMFRCPRQGDKLPSSFIHYIGACLHRSMDLPPSPSWSRSWSSSMASFSPYSYGSTIASGAEMGVSNIDAIGDGRPGAACNGSDRSLITWHVYVYDGSYLQ